MLVIVSLLCLLYILMVHTDDGHTMMHRYIVDTLIHCDFAVSTIYEVFVDTMVHRLLYDDSLVHRVLYDDSVIGSMIIYIWPSMISLCFLGDMSNLWGTIFIDVMAYQSRMSGIL